LAHDKKQNGPQVIIELHQSGKSKSHSASIEALKAPHQNFLLSYFQPNELRTFAADIYAGPGYPVFVFSGWPTSFPDRQPAKHKIIS
jgi:hypothetical protein